MTPVLKKSLMQIDGNSYKNGNHNRNRNYSGMIGPNQGSLGNFTTKQAHADPDGMGYKVNPFHNGIEEETK
jgi:hypothetical protein